MTSRKGGQGDQKHVLPVPSPYIPVCIVWSQRPWSGSPSCPTCPVTYTGSSPHHPHPHLLHLRPPHLHFLYLNILTRTFLTRAVCSYTIVSLPVSHCAFLIDISSSAPSSPAGSSPASCVLRLRLHHPHLQGPLLHLLHLHNPLTSLLHPRCPRLPPLHPPCPCLPLLHLYHPHLRCPQLCLLPSILATCIVHPLYLSSNFPLYGSKELAGPSF